jgi:hypothetical protein
MSSVNIFEASFLFTSLESRLTLGSRNFALRVLENVYLAQQLWEDAFDTHKLAFHFQIQTWSKNHFETDVLAHRMGCHYERRDKTDKAM